MRVALLLAALALVAASCGASASLDPVANAATQSSKQTSEHMQIDARVTTAGQVISMSGSGDFSNDPSRGTLTVDVGAGARKVSMREVMNGTMVYLSSDLFGGQLPSGKTWLAIDFSKAASALGVDFGALSTQAPASTLAQLKASSDVKKVGTETIDGVSTTHYTATIDPAKLAKLHSKLRVQVASAPVDIWVDDAGLVRRMHLAYSHGAGTTGAPAMSTDATISLSHYGEHVDVTVPSEAETFDLTKLASRLGSGGTS